MGPVEIPGLVAAEGTIAEFWLGPYGSQVVWVRQNDEDTYWYAGGDPVGAKLEASVAYFLPNDPNETKFRMGIASFLAHFKKKKKKVRRILFANFEGAPEGYVYPGFDAPLAEDNANLEPILKLSEGQIRVSMAINAKFDHRFIAKMALAIGYSLFGQDFLLTPNAAEAKRGLWPRSDETVELKGSPTLGREIDPRVTRFLGYPSAVAITVMRIGHQGYALYVSIDQKLPFTLLFAPSELSSPYVDPEHGYALLLFPSLKRSVVMTQVDLAVHNMGLRLHPELVEIETVRSAAAKFHSGLISDVVSLDNGLANEEKG